MIRQRLIQLSAAAAAAGIWAVLADPRFTRVFKG